MTVKEYIIAKNELLFKHTGIQLVPDNQIEDCPITKLSMIADSTACPYCMAYDLHYTDNCEGCPMQLAGNGCRDGINPDSANSTYNLLAKDIAITGYEEPWAEELADLIDQFNKENNL